MGQKSVGKKPTVRELDVRITEVEMLLSVGARRSQIHAALKAKYNIDWRTTDRYVRRARENLVAATHKTKDEHRIESYHFYLSMRMNPNVSETTRIRAQENIDSLFGLRAPTNVRVGDPEGRPLQGAIIAPIVNIIIPDNSRANNNGHAQLPPAQPVEVTAEITPQQNNNGNGEHK